MGEETEFWGIGTPKAWEEGNPLLPFTGTAPNRKPFWVYPVFDSREEAEQFAKEHYDWTTGDRFTLEELLQDIRKIEPDEIPSDHLVSYNSGEPVKWSELPGNAGPIA